MFDASVLLYFLLFFLVASIDGHCDFLADCHYGE